MANYNLVVNSKFQPFSFERYIQPYQMYGEAYKEVENALGELATKANVWEEMANEQTDPYAYKMYKTYANDLEEQAGQLAREGLNAASRRDMLNMRARYSKEITPIEQAYTARQKQAEEQQKALLQDPTLMLSRRAATTSLDDYIRNPQLAYESYSGKLLTAQVSQAASALAKEMQEQPRKWRSILGDSYYETMMQKGFSSQAVLQAIQNNPHAAPQLTNIVEDAIDSSGVRDWGDQAILDKAYESARQGLWSAVGETQYQILNNQRAGAPRQETGTGTPKPKTKNIDRTSYYFPKEREIIPNLINDSGKLVDNPNKFGVSSTYKRLVNDLFKNGKFTEPESESKASYSDRSTAAKGYYHEINNVLLNSGFSQEDINLMDKKAIEDNLKSIMENNAADVIGRSLYRVSLDDTSTGHLVSKLQGRGLKVQEMEGLKEGKPVYLKREELEYEKGQSGDILFDAASGDFLLLHQGKYYKLPSGMISQDLEDEIGSYLGESDGKASRLSEIQQSIEYLESKESLSSREQDLLILLYGQLDEIDTRLGTIGNEFIKYVGTKNIND